MQKMLALLIFGLGLLYLPSEAIASETQRVPVQQVAIIQDLSKKENGESATVLIQSGDKKGTMLTFPYDHSHTPGRPYKKGDKVLIAHIEGLQGAPQYFIVDYVRTDGILLLTLLFIIVAVTVARKKAVLSLISMAYTFFLIFKFLLPQILSGQNPIIIAIMTAFMIVPVTYYASNGFNKKTHSAVLGTIIALVLTSFLAYFAIEGTKLTGFASEDATYLQLIVKGDFNMKGLLLAGVIVGLLGILDDITISQAAIVFKLKENARHLSVREIYVQAMDIGKDHIGSIINTLILVYAGAALPFLLLFIAQGQSIGMGLNYELLAEEVVRTLVASIGLILAVPITTLIASLQK